MKCRRACGDEDTIIELSVTNLRRRKRQETSMEYSINFNYSDFQSKDEFSQKYWIKHTIGIGG